jgi:hypothetical protein
MMGRLIIFILCRLTTLIVAVSSTAFGQGTPIVGSTLSQST